MTYEQACHIIDQFSDMGGLHVTLSGGEVFLHKDIIRILQYCRKKRPSNLYTLKSCGIKRCTNSFHKSCKCFIYTSIFV